MGNHEVKPKSPAELGTLAGKLAFETHEDQVCPLFHSSVDDNAWYEAYYASFAQEREKHAKETEA